MQNQTTRIYGVFEWMDWNQPKQIKNYSNLTCKFISKHNLEDYFTRNQNTSLKLTEKLTEQIKLAESYDLDDDYKDVDKSKKHWRSLGKPGQW